MDQKQYFNAVYDETYADILRYAVIKTGNAEAVEDIVQNVYQNFYKRIVRRGFLDIHEPKAFLVTLAKKELSRHYARKKTTAEHYTDTPVEECAGDFPFEQFVENRELSQKIWEAVKRGPLLSYQVFVLFYGYDKPISSVAQILNITEQNVKNRLFRTRNMVRTMLTGGDSDYE